MQISKNRSSYESTIHNNNSVQQSKPLNRVKQFIEAFRVDLSSRALSSKEFNDPNIYFPTHNPDVLQYSNNLNLILKP